MKSSATNQHERLLSFSLEKQQHDIVDMFLADDMKQGTFYDKDEYGKTIAHYAVARVHINLINEFVSKGLENDKVLDKNNETPLHYACIHGCTDIVSTFIQNRVNINCKNAQGQTPLDLAIEYGHDDIEEILLKFKVKAELTASSDDINSIVNYQSIGTNSDDESDSLIELEDNWEIVEPADNDYITRRFLTRVETEKDLKYTPGNYMASTSTSSDDKMQSCISINESIALPSNQINSEDDLQSYLRGL